MTGLTISRSRVNLNIYFVFNNDRYKLTLCRTMAKILTDSCKSNRPIETLYDVLGDGGPLMHLFMSFKVIKVDCSKTKVRTTRLHMHS